MAIIDRLTQFADGQDAFASGATVNVGDVIDLDNVNAGLNNGGAQSRDIGNGQPVYVHFFVDADFVGGTSVQFHVVSDDVSTPDLVTRTVHVETGAIPVASLTAGSWVTLQLSAGQNTTGNVYERYLGVQATTVGVGTAGKINAFVSYDPFGWRAYKQAKIN